VEQADKWNQERFQGKHALIGVELAKCELEHMCSAWYPTDAECLDEGEEQYVEETLGGAMVDDRMQ